MKINLLCGVFLCCTAALFAQKTINGRVLDTTNGEPLAYVSIGIQGTSVGTVAGPDGYFTLEIPDNQGGNVQFSLIGFATQSMPVSSLLSSGEQVFVRLAPTALAIREVTIRPDLTRKEVLGKEKMRARMVVNFALEGKINQNLGSEIGRRFRIHKPSQLEKFSFYLADNDFDTVRFRINVYDLKKGKPGDNLLTDNVVVAVVGKSKGWVTVDLAPYDLRVEESLAIGVEWIYGSRGGTVLSLPIGMPVAGSKHFYKYGSRNHWKSFALMSAAMALEVRQ